MALDDGGLVEESMEKEGWNGGGREGTIGAGGQWI